MDTVIVYVDDAEYTRQIIHPLAHKAGGKTTHWVLVACAPRMTHRISKWVSHSARESWRAKWSDKLFAQVLPWLETGNAQVSTVLAKTPLPELMEQLQQQYGASAQLLDARRPKQVNPDFQMVPEQPATNAVVAPPAAPSIVVKKPSRSWTLPSTLASLFCVVMVAVD